VPLAAARGKSSITLRFHVTLAEFTRALFENGRVALSKASRPVPPAELDEARRALREVEWVFRQDLPGDPPAFRVEDALWAAMMMHGACRLLVYRFLGPDDVARELAAQGPAPTAPESIYAVDLSFRFLPDLFRHCRAAAEEDPLTMKVLDWCHAWPLSSVGVPGVGGVDSGPILVHPCLRTVYIDRIIRHQDHARVADPAVLQAVQEAVGLHTELSGGLLKSAPGKVREEP
jgi:hypothetical protein